MKFKSLSIVVSLVCPLWLLGCESSDQLPTNAEIRIAPQSHAIAITPLLDDQGYCLFNSNNYIDTPFVMSMHDGQGSPIGNAELSISVDYSGQTYAGPQLLSLYEDRNSNGVVDDESELVTDVSDFGYTAITEKYSGDAALILRINLSCEFRANVHVFSLFTHSSMNVSVEAKQEG